MYILGVINAIFMGVLKLFSLYRRMRSFILKRVNGELISKC